MQKFKRGDVVMVADDLGPHMSHFRAGAEAIVMGSYADKFGSSDPYCSNDFKSFTLMFTDNGNQSSWYEEEQLTLLHHGGDSYIAEIERLRDERHTVEANLDWILENWKAIREQPPGASIDFLMRQIGITEPWGKHGEGFVWHANASGTILLLDDVLCAGDKSAALARMNKLRDTREAMGRPGHAL